MVIDLTPWTWRTGALRIVGCHDVGRHMGGVGPATRERRHEDAIGKCECAERDRSEERRVRHGGGEEEAERQKEKRIAETQQPPRKFLDKN